MPKHLSPERVALLNRLVEDRWPLMEINRTHHFDWKTVRRYHPEYRGLDLTEAAKLGNAARQVTLRLRRSHPHLKTRGTLVQQP